MKKNVGKIDKAFRIVIGFAAFGLGYYFQSWWGLLGIIPLATAFMGSCPLYLPLGISTIVKKK